MFHIFALILEIAIATFFAFKSLQAYDRGATVRVFVYGSISMLLSFYYIYYAGGTEKLDVIMGIAMCAFMFMVACPMVQLGKFIDAPRGASRDPETKRQRLEKLNEPLPDAAPLPYRLLRGIVQHFPYRVALLAFGVYVYSWHMEAMTVTSTLIYLGYWILALINGAYPFMTRPLRYRLITAVDGTFERLYECQKRRRARTAEVVRARDKAPDE